MHFKRIHLAAPGGGAACGAHSRGAPKPKYPVMASHVAALVDCRKCKHSSQWKAIFDPPRQYQLRLFAMVNNKEPPRKLSVAELGTNPAVTRVEIWLDGVKQDCVIEYDADAGWLERYKRENGRFAVKGDKLATERVTGNIELKWKAAA